MKNRITNDEVELLLAGRTPEGRPGFGELAAVVAALRSEAFETAPRPSDELAARLGVPHEELVSAATSTAGSSKRLAGDSSVAVARTPRSSAIARVVERVSGFGLAARIAAGVGALLLGIGAAGAAGALPGGMQDAFDDLVSTVIPIEHDAEVVIIDEQPTVDDESVDGGSDESGGDEVAPGEETSPDDSDEDDSDEDESPPGDDVDEPEPDGDSETEETVEGSGGESEPELDSTDSGSD